MRILKSTAIVVAIGIVLCHLFIARALERTKADAFTDPSVTMDMPESWVKQPIKHDPAQGKADMVINLNRQVYQALYPLIERFEQDNRIKIVVTKGTCGISAGLMKKKQADIVMLCCPPGKVDRLPGIEFHTIGIMPLAFLVHPDNHVEDLTVEQLREIFQGNISRWSEISDSQGRPGKNTPIQVIARRHCKKRPGHWKLLLPESQLFSAKTQEVGAIPDMIKLIADNPSAIGYEVMQMVREYENIGELKPLKINGVGPGEGERLLTGEYPFYRTYSFTTWNGEGLSNPHARRLVDYILTEAGKVDAEYGIVTAAELKEAGWQFRGNELIGEPE
jgi:hypothetical protein